jgi:hypothetical protein
MPAVNDKIFKADYNNIRNKVVSVLGTSSSGNFGYGQRIISSAVSESNKVSVNDWGNLRYDLINAWTHINGSPPGLVSVAEGDTIRYNLTTAPVDQFNTIADSIVTNRLATPPAGQRITVNKGSSSTTWPGPYGSSWASLAQCTVTIDFSSAAAARHFFNSGGYVTITSSQSGGSGTSQNTSWRNLLSSAGGRAWGGNTPGSGTSPQDGLNFFRCTNSFQNWYSTSASSPYGSNSYILQARTPFVSNNATGTANVIEIRILFQDNHVGIAGGPDFVNGTFSVAVETLEAFGVLQPITAGNFTVESPRVTLSAVSS